ncbi:MAG TPA: helix-turn-helix domain-containing protein [Candidatus Scubalenecus merdavium]|uniref:Helix-turn-helix domain-containing protein n=1 Tax=Candidatus Scybalenecus merdavium TaxID=2840939 RepID=A0A9D1MVH6_9FIRM|nr:helix-turn-helix domain-containing protein [Candidatus Scubalenecus merdavium]
MSEKDEMLLLMKKHGISSEKMAEIIGTSKSTFYRKLNGESDFYRNEIIAMGRVLPVKEVNRIFFNEKVS